MLLRMTRVIGTCARWLCAFGAALVVLTMLLIASDIGARNLWNQPVSGVPELVSLAIVCVVYLALPNALCENRLSRVTGLLDLLSRRWPSVRCIVESIIYTLSGLLLLRLVSISTVSLVKAWDRQLYIGAIGQLTVPLWPVKLVVVVGCLVVSLQCLAMAASWFSRALSSNANSDNR